MSLPSLLLRAGIPSRLTFAVLRSVKHGRDDNALLRPIDLVHHDIGQSRHRPFKRKGIATDMAHERKRDQQLRAAKKPLDHDLRGGRTVLGNPIKDVFEIDQRLIVVNKLHTASYEPSRAMRSRASA